MYHRIRKNALGIATNHRKALLRNLASALITNGKVVTTIAKAKTVKSIVEKMVTKAKNNTVHAAELKLQKDLPNQKVVKKLISDVAPRFKDINGGYTRIVKKQERAGDCAKMARLEWAHDEKPTKTKKVVAKDSKEIVNKVTKGIKE